MAKRVIGIGLAAVLGILSVSLYQSETRVERARLRTSNAARQIEILEGGAGFIRWNARLYRELGWAHFQSGAGRLQDAASRDADFRTSHRYYLRALTLSPLSAGAHFEFAQALQYMGYFNLGITEDPLEEYKKAARLSGSDPQIYGAAGKVMFGRWGTLSPEDRAYAQDIVRSVLFEQPTSEDIETFLGLWELNVKDPAVLNKILPQDADVDRQVARFLGERSLSRDERIRFLSQAEVLDFGKAREAFAAGQTAMGGLKIEEARAHFRDSRAALDRITFAQNLIGKDMIDRLEYRDLKKSVLLGLAKCSLEETRKLDGAIAELTAYLELEDNSSAIGELEMFLKERNIIEGKTDVNVQDFNRFLFEVLLGFKQNRFREIIQAGLSLERSLLVIPDSMKADYVRVLEIIGDSYRKLDYIYESNRFYTKALETGGPDVELFLKMRKNYERLNDRERLRSLEKSIQDLLPAAEEDLSKVVLAKDAPLARDYILDGRKFVLTVVFDTPGPEPLPLVSVLYNGQLAWEDYLGKPELTLALPSEIGRNSLKIMVENRSIRLKKIKIKAEPSGTRPEIGL